jgi:hypothetical protein
MADPGTQPLRNGPEVLSGAAIPFRFEVTWRSLTEPLGPTGAAAAVSKVLQPALSRDDTEAKEWEMVLPRMRRPAALAATPVPDSRPPMAAPSFASAVERRPQRWIFPAGAALLLALALIAYRSTGQGSAPETTAAITDMGGVGWVSEWASDATGSGRGRQISLYRPSLAMSDYRLEFLGRIERRSLGWVFRAVDSRDYYAAKLQATPSGLVITRFTVIRGAEGAHIERPIPISIGFGATIKVRLDAIGPRFTIYVQNQVVEDWEDDRLKTGGVGFLNEREERGQVSSVQISFPKGGRQ